MAFFFNGTNTKSVLYPVNDSKDAKQEDNQIGANNAIDSQNATIIKRTNTGYEPQIVTIKKGENIIFINESDDFHWPASDIHPTHKLYPQKSSDNCLGSDFDACKALAPDTTWMFKFNQAGRWSFHDHLRANFKGAVIVADN